MRVRKAFATDVPAVMALIERVVPVLRESGNFQWDEDYPDTEAFATDVELGQLYVAEIDGALAGVGAFTTGQDPDYASVGWDLSENAIVVHRLATDATYRGRGVAAALMNHAEVVAMSHHIDVMRTDTNAVNDAAQQLFLKLGYTYSGEIDLSFRPGIRFRCYEKRIGVSVPAGNSTTSAIERTRT